MKMKRFIFDLDNTLIYTNLLNNRAYNYALSKLNLKPINGIIRLTKSIVFSHYRLTEEEKDKILYFKKEFYLRNLKYTRPNVELISILKEQKREHCILWTSADEWRVLLLLKYYGINNSFKEIIYSEKINIEEELKKISCIFECGLKELIICEDNENIVNEILRLKINVMNF